MANRFLPKRSTVPGAVPTTAQLLDGELGINIADKIIYQRNGASVVAVASYGGGGGAAWGSITGTLTSQTDLAAALNDKADLTGANFSGAVNADYGAGTASTVAAIAATNGAQWVRFFAKLPAGSYISTVQANDSAMLFSQGTSATGALVIAAWGGSVAVRISATDIVFTGEPTFSNGITSAGGLDFGSVVVATATDLTRHIALHTSANYGFSVTAARLNYNTNTNGSHVFLNGSTDIVTINASGLTCTNVVASTGTSAGINFDNRSGTARTYTWYATANSVRLFAGGGVINDMMTITEAGIVTNRDGIELGFRQVPINTSNAAYTFVKDDAGKCRMHTDTTARTYTLPVSVFSPGDVITVLNHTGTGAITIAVAAGGTQYLAGSATTGSRTVAVRGMATIFCAVGGASPVFYTSGPGVT